MRLAREISSKKEEGVYVHDFKKGWDEILRLAGLGVDTRNLEDAFSDFECEWTEHMHRHGIDITAELLTDPR